MLFRKVISAPFFLGAAVLLLSAIKVPALLMISGFLFFVGFVLWNAQGNAEDQMLLPKTGDPRGEADPDGPIDMQIVGLYGQYGLARRAHISVTEVE